MSRIQRKTHHTPQKLPDDVVTTTVVVELPKKVTSGGKEYVLEKRTNQPLNLVPPNILKSGTGAQVIAMADLLAKATGAAGDALLKTTPGLAASLRLFAGEFEATAASGHQALALKALRYHAVHADGPLPAAMVKALGGTTAQLATEYARDLGFQGVKLEGQQWQLLGGATPLKLAAGDGSFQALGRAINEHRFNTDTVLPPHKSVAVDAREFDVGNAHLAVHLSTLAYQPKEVVLAQLEKWGFDTSTFRWIESKTSDTQGFVVADKKGNVFPVFRGSESGTDWGTNANTTLGTAGWTPKPDFKTHKGFTKALDSVWPQVKEALEQAKRAAGPNAKVMFAGHSLGGALTQLAAVRAAREGLVDGRTSSIYTLGSPRVGNEAFKNELERLVPNAYRLVNYREGFFDKQDVVTQIPPKAMGFRHAGSMARLGPETMELIDRLSSNAKLAESVLAMASDAADDPSDEADPEIEQMNQEELEAFMRHALSGASDVSRANHGPAPAPKAHDMLAMNGGAEMIQVPSVSAHSTGVYLDRMGVQTLAEPNLFG